MQENPTVDMIPGPGSQLGQTFSSWAASSFNTSDLTEKTNLHVPEVVTNASGNCSALYVKQDSQDN